MSWPGADEPRVDLHLHSTASDGSDAPAELVRRAAEAGLAGLSLTDHDTVDGLDEAAREAERLGIRFLPGAELSANEPGRSVHVLAYGFDRRDPEFRDFLSGWRETRLRRAEEIVARLRREGLDVTLRDVQEQADEGVLTRAHVGRALVALGLVPNQNAAFDRYLSRGRPAFVEKPPLRPPEVTERVHAAGGVTLVAHPGRSQDVERIREWAERGMDGVEILHPSNDDGVRARLDDLASELNLLRGGGSDWHGPDDHRPPLGSEPVPLAWMEAIEARCRSRSPSAAGAVEGGSEAG